MSFPNSETMLIFDGDLIVYQKGFKHENTKEWWVVESDIDRWITDFFKKFGTYNYVIYLTGQGNFRETLAVTHKYKDRPTRKPKWYSEVKNYLYAMHRTEIAEGWEADDEIAMHLTRNPNSIHIGIDKDLLQVEGWHYRYATHNSPEVPLRFISNEGFLELPEKGSKKRKLKGGGYPWFYAQMLLGDSTDSIYAPKGYGDVKVHEALKDCETEKDFYDVVEEIYKQEYGEQWEARLYENANLLWMIRELDDGVPVLWRKPE